MKKYLVLIISVAAIFIFVGSVSAHQPRLVEEEGTVKVESPEISQAFYGSLSGDKQIFEINSDKKFSLYVNILVPKTEDAKKGMVIEIMKDGMILAVLDGSSYEWTEFHEPFAGDDYWMGPQFRQDAEPGRYVIRVISPDGTGKYALAIGEQESFGPSEIVRTTLLLPSIKKEIFGRSIFAAYFNYTGLFLLAVLVIFSILVYLVIWFIRRSKKKSHVNNPSNSSMPQYRTSKESSRQTLDKFPSGINEEEHSE